EFRLQKELLPEVVSVTRGYELPGEGLKLWEDLLKEVQACKSPDDARKIRRTMLDIIDTRKTVSLIHDLEEAMIELLGSRSSSTEAAQVPAAVPSSPAPKPDFSGVRDPAWRKTFEDAARAAELLRQEGSQDGPGLRSLRKRLRREWRHG